LTSRSGSCTPSLLHRGAAYELVPVGSVHRSTMARSRATATAGHRTQLGCVRDLNPLGMAPNSTGEDTSIPKVQLNSHLINIERWSGLTSAISGRQRRRKRPRLGPGRRCSRCLHRREKGEGRISVEVACKLDGHRLPVHLGVSKLDCPCR